MHMSNRIYDTLKWIALTALPAVTGLLAALTPIWEIPNGDKLVLTIAAVNAALGAIVGVSGVQHQKAVTAEYDANS